MCVRAGCRASTRASAVRIESKRSFRAARIAEAAAAHGNLLACGSSDDVLERDHRARGVAHSERNGRAASCRALRTMDLNERPAVGMSQGAESVDERRRHVTYVLFDQLRTDPLEKSQAVAYGVDGEKVRCAILERFATCDERVTGVLRSHPIYGAAGKPRPAEYCKRAAPRDQCANPRREAKHLVEGQADEVGLHLIEAKHRCGRERRRVEQHVIAERGCARRPLQRISRAGEVRLRRKCEEVRPTHRCARQQREGIRRRESLVDRDVPHPGAGAFTEL